MNKTINTNEFFSLVNMINSGNEDFEVAIENIKNLKLNDLYIKLLYKAVNLSRRSEFATAIESLEYKIKEVPENFTLNALYDEIKNNDTYEYQDIFENIIGKLLLNITTMTFVKDIKVTIR